MRFQDCIGQEEVAARLTQSHKEGRVAHAQLFLGPEGSGNLALAMAFAQYLLCPNRTENDSCGVCITCKKVSSLQYADLHFSFPFIRKDDKSTSEDFYQEWREAVMRNPYMDPDHWQNQFSDTKQVVFTVAEGTRIIRKVNLRGYEGPLKIMIIWMAEYIKIDTANRLLKLLEEPPANSLFFLVANQSDQILPTVMSRMQVIRVNAIADKVIVSELLKQGVSDQRAAAIAHYAKGNWWLASKLAEDGEASDFFDTFKRWMQLCYKRDAVGLLEVIDQLSNETRSVQKQFLNYSLEMVRQNIVLNYAGPSLTRMNSQEEEFSKRFAAFINDLNAEDMMMEIGRAHSDIGRNVYSKLVLTDLSFKVHRFLHRTP